MPSEVPENECIEKVVNYVLCRCEMGKHSIGPQKL